MNYTIKHQVDVISLCVSVTALSLITAPTWAKALQKCDQCLKSFWSIMF